MALKKIRPTIVAQMKSSLEDVKVKKVKKVSKKVSK